MIQLWPEGAPLAEGHGAEDQPSIMPYLLDGSNRAAVIVCPGGSYMGLADHEGEPVAQWLNTIGISAFVLRYRVAPYKYPSALLDAKRAIRYVRHYAAQLGIDPKKIGMLGFSAGGHLTATAATHFDTGQKSSNDPIEHHSSRPDLQILGYPVITMQGEHAHTDSKKSLLGDTPDKASIALLSNEQHITANTPPAFLWHTADDHVVVEHSLLYAAALSQHKVPFDLHIYQKGPHGLGLAAVDDHIRTWTELCALWLGRHNFTSST